LLRGELGFTIDALMRRILATWRDICSLLEALPFSRQVAKIRQVRNSLPLSNQA
jgi:hypothetical protein